MVSSDASPQKEPKRLTRRQAVAGTVVGGVLAQGGSLLFVVIGIAALMAYHGKTDVESFENLPGAALVLTASALAASVFLLGASFATPRLAGVRVRTALGLTPAPLWTYAAAALGALGFGPVGGLTLDAMKKLAPSLTLGTVDFLNDFASDNTALLVWPLLALMPAVCEELFFRGLLQRAFGPTRWAIVISGVAFALFHLDPHHVAAVLPIGLYMAWLAARTGSTLVPIAAHLTNNSLAVIAMQLQDEAVPSPVDDSTPLWALPPALLAIAASIVIVLRATDQPRVPSSGPLHP